MNQENEIKDKQAQEPRDYQAIDRLLEKHEFLELITHLNDCVTDITAIFSDSKIGQKGKVMKRLSALIDVNHALKDVYLAPYLKDWKENGHPFDR